MLLIDAQRRRARLEQRRADRKLKLYRDAGSDGAEATIEVWRAASLHLVSEQAVSGAGYPGVSSMDMIDNIVPYVPGDEDKMESNRARCWAALTATASST